MNRRLFLQALCASLALTAVSPHLPQLAGPAAPVEPIVALRSFQSMLNDYCPVELIREELMKRDYLLSNLSEDNWSGGKIVVPLKYT